MSLALAGRRLSNAIALVVGLTVYGRAQRETREAGPSGDPAGGGCRAREAGDLGLDGGTGPDAEAVSRSNRPSWALSIRFCRAAPLVVEHGGSSNGGRGPGPIGAARDFDLTAALASRIGTVSGRGTVRWRFAG